MSISVKNDGSSQFLAWSGTATAILFRDGAGRLVRGWTPSGWTREAAWPPGAASAEIRGDVQPRSVPQLAAETTTVLRAAVVPPAPGRRRVVVVASAPQRLLSAVSLAISWAVTGTPTAGPSVAYAVAAARAWMARGREVVARRWTSG